MQAYYYDKQPELSNEEFDNLKDELTWEGSKVVVLRCGAGRAALSGALGALLTSGARRRTETQNPPCLWGRTRRMERWRVEGGALELFGSGGGQGSGGGLAGWLLGLAPQASRGGGAAGGQESRQQERSHGSRLHRDGPAGGSGRG